jgi:hypothetical protein
LKSLIYILLLTGTGALIATIINTPTLAVHHQKQQTKIQIAAPTAFKNSPTAPKLVKLPQLSKTPSNSQVLALVGADVLQGMRLAEVLALVGANVS